MAISLKAVTKLLLSQHVFQTICFLKSMICSYKNICTLEPPLDISWRFQPRLLIYRRLTIFCKKQFIKILNCIFHFTKEISSYYHSKSIFSIFIIQISNSKRNFSFFRCEFTTQKWKNLSLTMELATRSETLFFNFALVTRK